MWYPQRSSLPIVLGLLLGCAAASADTFSVVNTGDSGPGTLHQAILDANAHPGADVIAFGIPGTGVQTITLTSPLPVITDPVTIDGYTQPGASPNMNGPGLGLNTELTIQVDGWDAGEHGCLVCRSNTATTKASVSPPDRTRAIGSKAASSERPPSVSTRGGMELES